MKHETDEGQHVRSDDQLGAAATECGAPSYWFGPGLAPNFSRQVAKANEAVKDAQQELLETLRLGYPEGKRVAVIHYRGHFYGHVVGWDCRGCRVAVKNEATLKVSKWWAAHVQLSN